MPFLPPNQQLQSTEGYNKCCNKHFILLQHLFLPSVIWHLMSGLQNYHLFAVQCIKSHETNFSNKHNRQFGVTESHKNGVLVSVKNYSLTWWPSTVSNDPAIGWTKSITLTVVNGQWWNFFNSRVWKNVPEGSTLTLGDTKILQDKPKEKCVKKWPRSVQRLMRSVGGVFISID